MRDPATLRWRLDIFREPSDGEISICRRDERIRLPYVDVIEWTEEGIPYGRPEIILLFKAKHADRPKDEADFTAVLPKLDSARRSWLVDALRLLHPGHPWLDRNSPSPMVAPSLLGWAGVQERSPELVENLE